MSVVCPSNFPGAVDNFIVVCLHVFPEVEVNSFFESRRTQPKFDRLRNKKLQRRISEPHELQWMKN